MAHRLSPSTLAHILLLAVVAVWGATFVLVHKVQDKPAQGAATLKFFDWAYVNGDKAASELDYIVLPDAVKAMVRKEWASVKDGSGNAIAMK